jgi:platelet-activating factor acetylhydrolase IB subunit alpha
MLMMSDVLSLGLYSFCVKTFTGHSEWVRCVVPSEDGQLLASCSNDQVRPSLTSRSPFSSSLYPPLLPSPGKDAKLRQASSISRFFNLISFLFFQLIQSSRIWDFSSGETKMDLRGHEHVVECVTFAPVISYPAIRELAGIKVRLLSSPPLHFLPFEALVILSEVLRYEKCSAWLRAMLTTM